KDKPKPNTTKDKPNTNKGQGTGKSLLALSKEITTAPDMSSILTFQGSTLVLDGKNCIYLSDISKPGAPPDRIEERNRVLGLSDGHIAIIDNYTAVSQNFIDGANKTLFRNPPRADIMSISKSGELLAVKKGRTVSLSRIVDGKRYILKKATVGSSNSGFTMAVNDNYLVFVQADTLRVWAAVKGKKEARQILELPLPASSASTGPVLQQSGHLLAVESNGNNIDIFNLKSAKKIRTIYEPGQILALAFSPHSDKIIISRKGRIIIRDAKSEFMNIYRSPEKDMEVVDMAFISKGLIALDKKNSKLKLLTYDTSKL
ncbi:MAG: hypothetical protein GY765_25875, partial [bacterium]|nr:hypothetical protein [bacterium]